MRDHRKLSERQWLDILFAAVDALCRGCAHELPRHQQERVGRRLMLALIHGDPVSLKRYARALRGRLRNAHIAEAALALPGSPDAVECARTLAAIVTGKVTWRRYPPQVHEFLERANEYDKVPRSSKQLASIIRPYLSQVRRTPENFPGGDFQERSGIISYDLD